MSLRYGFKAVTLTLGSLLVFLIALWSSISITVIWVALPNDQYKVCQAFAVLPVAVVLIGTAILGAWLLATTRDYWRALMSEVMEAMSLRRRQRQRDIINSIIPDMDAKDRGKYKVYRNLNVYPYW